MRPKPEDAMWCLIMFDLPVQSKEQRKEATKFRKLLIDSGYALIQYSVYGKYSPTIQSNMAVERFLKANRPRMARCVYCTLRTRSGLQQRESWRRSRASKNRRASNSLSSRNADGLILAAGGFHASLRDSS